MDGVLPNEGRAPPDNAQNWAKRVDERLLRQEDKPTIWNHTGHL